MSHPLVEQLKNLTKEELMQFLDLIGQWQELSEEDREKLKNLSPNLAKSLHNFSHFIKVKRE